MQIIAKCDPSVLEIKVSLCSLVRCGPHRSLELGFLRLELPKVGELLLLLLLKPAFWARTTMVIQDDLATLIDLRLRGAAITAQPVRDIPVDSNRIVVGIACALTPRARG